MVAAGFSSATSPACRGFLARTARCGVCEPIAIPAAMTSRADPNQDNVRVAGLTLRLQLVDQLLDLYPAHCVATLLELPRSVATRASSSSSEWHTPP